MLAYFDQVGFSDVFICHTNENPGLRLVGYWRLVFPTIAWMC